MARESRRIVIQCGITEAADSYMNELSGLHISPLRDRAGGAARLAVRWSAVVVVLMVMMMVAGASAATDHHHHRHHHHQAKPTVTHNPEANTHHRDATDSADDRRHRNHQRADRQQSRLCFDSAEVYDTVSGLFRSVDLDDSGLATVMRQCLMRDGGVLIVGGNRRCAGTDDRFSGSDHGPRFCPRQRFSIPPTGTSVAVGSMAMARDELTGIASSQWQGAGCGRWRRRCGTVRTDIVKKFIATGDMTESGTDRPPRRFRTGAC